MNTLYLAITQKENMKIIYVKNEIGVGVPAYRAKTMLMHAEAVGLKLLTHNLVTLSNISNGFAKNKKVGGRFLNFEFLNTLNVYFYASLKMKGDSSMKDYIIVMVKSLLLLGGSIFAQGKACIDAQRFIGFWLQVRRDVVANVMSQVFFWALSIAADFALSRYRKIQLPTSPTTSSIPNITGPWNIATTQGEQTSTSNILLLQSQDNESNVAMILPIQQGTWNEGGYGFNGQINGNEIVLTYAGNSRIIFQGIISNGLITGTTAFNGQNRGTFEMSNMQSLTVSQQNFDLSGKWQFTLTSEYTLNFTNDIYQYESDLVNVITSSPSLRSLQGIAFFGTLQGNSVTFTVWEPYQIQLIGNLLTSNLMRGNFTVGSKTETWSANRISSTYQSKKQKS